MVKTKAMINFYKWVCENLRKPEEVSESARFVIIDALSFCKTKRELSIALWAALDCTDKATPNEIEEMLDEAVDESENKSNTNADIISYQAKTLAEMERQLNTLRQLNADLMRENEILSDALNRALGNRDRVFVPRKYKTVEYTVESTIDNDYIIIRK